MKEAACLKDYSAISPLRRRHQSTLRAWRGKHFHRDDISGGNITLETTPAPPPLLFLSPPTPPSLPHTDCQETQCRLGSRSRSTTCERMHANEDATTHELKRSTTTLLYHHSATHLRGARGFRLGMAANRQAGAARARPAPTETRRAEQGWR